MWVVQPGLSQCSASRKVPRVRDCTHGVAPEELSDESPRSRHASFGGGLGWLRTQWLGGVSAAGNDGPERRGRRDRWGVQLSPSATGEPPAGAGSARGLGEGRSARSARCARQGRPSPATRAFDQRTCRPSAVLRHQRGPRPVPHAPASRSRSRTGRCGTVPPPVENFPCAHLSLKGSVALDVDLIPPGPNHARECRLEELRCRTAQSPTPARVPDAAHLVGMAPQTLRVGGSPHASPRCPVHRQDDLTG